MIRILPKSLQSISQKKSYALQQGVIWGAPSILVPTLRFSQDPPNIRWQLFARDLSTYGVGILANFSVGMLAAKTLQKKVPNPHLRQLLSVIAGVASYIAFAVLGAPRLSRFVSQGSTNTQPPRTTPPPFYQRPAYYTRPAPVRMTPPSALWPQPYPPNPYGK